MSYTTVPPFPTPVRKAGAPLVAIIALGTIAALILTLLTAADPARAALGFVPATLATAVVLLCYLWLDRWEPEPPRLLVLAFLWGASVAVVLSVALEHLLENLVATGRQQTSFFTAAVGAPVIEEATKGLFLLLMMTGHRRRELNTLTDCLVYAGITAAGFAWLENIFYIASAETPAASVAIAGLRLVLSPFAHPLFTTMFGIGVHFALRQRGTFGKVACLLIGYAAAVLLHGMWNGSALLGAGTYLGVYVLWMMPIFGLSVALAVASRRREQRIVAEKLPGMVAAGLITPAEASWLGSFPARKLAVQTALRYGGKPAGSAVKKFASRVVELAYVRDRIDRGFGDERVFAMQNEEVYAVAAARANAAPALHQLSWFRFRSGPGY
ncbi:MAG: PrsW family intramembrane metalloprotease [Mycobacterium sp.]